MTNQPRQQSSLLSPLGVASEAGRRARSLAIAALLVPALLSPACFASAHAEDQTTTPATDAAPAPDRAQAYYHFGLAHMYEEMATNTGRQDYATRAIEEYKLALNADPTSPYLNNGLAQLYFGTGRVRDAILAAQDMIKKDPNDLEAHKLLGRIYLRSLGEGQNAETQKMLDLSIGEFTKITQLQPNDIESHLLLGQLYTLDHDSAHAREQFEAAEKIDPNNEDVALSLARLYGDTGDIQRSVEVLKSVPAEDRTAKISYALGLAYDQLRDNKEAIEAYRDAVDQEPDNPDAQRALGQDLLNDNQLAPALKVFQDLAVASPQDEQAYIRISEIQRRQGNYQDSLTALKKARALASKEGLVEIDYEEALIQDCLGHYDEAIALLKKVLSDTEQPHYSESERSNRGLFLDRLAVIHREQNHTDEAIATYQQMIALGGDFAVRGYEGEDDAYRDARQYDKATIVAKEAAAKLPKERGLQLMLALQLADMGKADEAVKIEKAEQANGTISEHELEENLAQIYIRLRRWKDATDQLDLAEKSGPYAAGVDASGTKETKAAADSPGRQDDQLAILFLRGSVEERQKHYDAAEVYFKKILAIDPNNMQTLNYYGYMLADRGVQLEDALRMVQKAVQLDPQNYAYLDSLGWTYFKLGQYTLAEDNLRQASQRMGTDPTVHDHLGELYEKTGRLKLAAEQWEISLGEYETSMPGDTEPGDVNKVQKKLEMARVRLAKGTPGSASSKE
jgi:tetratricopeptide (TPR) repeat protein